tara:strand:- start:2012 stop:2197 length:186 start_codon:yes stop_codon:yes gene_type:complete
MPRKKIFDLDNDCIEALAKAKQATGLSEKNLIQHLIRAQLAVVVAQVPAPLPSSLPTDEDS